MLKIGILISGRGSNMQALIKACAMPDFPAEVACVISNKADAAGVEAAQAAKIPTLVISHKDYPDRASFDAAMEEKLIAHGVQLVCLAGFLRILSEGFVERWRDRLVNIHPSLLPAFGGLYGSHVHEKVLEHGVKVTGCTVHYMRAAVDSGPIIVQKTVPVLEQDEVETLAARVLAAEHESYPEALRLIAEGRVNVINERTFISGSPHLFDHF